MTSEKLTFPNRDGIELAARLVRPSGAPRAFALFAHCFTCSKDSAAATRIAAELAQRGIAVLRFDFTGLGNSAGDFANTDFSSNVTDLVDAARFLAANERPPELLIGHSLGGAAVLFAAAELDAVRAVVTIGAPSEPEHVRRHLASVEDELAERGEARIVLAGRAFTIKQSFIDDLDQRKLAPLLAELRRPLLVMHSPVDQVVGIDNARRIYEGARGSKSFVSLHDADHLLTARADGIYVAELVAAWASRYLTPAAEPEQHPAAPGDPGAELALEPGEVRVASTAEPFLTELHTVKHALVADEPAKLGGRDAGPTPYDLLLAGLGACTSMTLGMYARRKKWPLEKVVVRLRHDRVHAKDCEDCGEQADQDQQIDRLFRDISLQGPLDAEQRARLLEIANRCPVHKTLEGPLAIPTQLVDHPA